MTEVSDDLPLAESFPSKALAGALETRCELAYLVSISIVVGGVVLQDHVLATSLLMLNSPSSKCYIVRRDRGRSQASTCKNETSVSHLVRLDGLQIAGISSHCCLRADSPRRR